MIKQNWLVPSFPIKNSTMFFTVVKGLAVKNGKVKGSFLRSKMFSLTTSSRKLVQDNDRVRFPLRYVVATKCLRDGY